MRWPPLVPAVMTLVACAHAGPAPAPVAVVGTPVSVEADPGVGSADVADVATLAGEALPAVQRWGGLRVATRVVIVPSHAALEARVDQDGYGWLRAWARYDVVYLQSPRSWNFLGLRPSRGELRELLTHELSHCAMYQAAGDAETWRFKQIPLWFREGLASWTAGQAWKRLSRATLARELASHPGEDPLAQADVLTRTQQPVVYASAHWAFDLLAARGQDRVSTLLASMHAGARFPEAFAEAYGEDVHAFEREALERLRRGD